MEVPQHQTSQNNNKKIQNLQAARSKKWKHVFGWKHIPIHKSNTSVICPLSEELIVLSMFALKFHLKIDIKELSFTNSKSGKDLPKESYHQYQLFQTLLMVAEHAIITRVEERNFYQNHWNCMINQKNGWCPTTVYIILLIILLR